MVLVLLCYPWLGLQLELDSTKASLRRTQSEKKVLKLEKGELEVSLSSANASAEARIKEEVSKERSNLQEKIAFLESQVKDKGMYVMNPVLPSICCFSSRFCYHNNHHCELNNRFR